MRSEKGKDYKNTTFLLFVICFITSRILLFLEASETATYNINGGAPQGAADIHQEVLQTSSQKKDLGRQKYLDSVAATSLKY